MDHIVAPHIQETLRNIKETPLIYDRLLKIDAALQIIPMAKSTFWQKVKEGVLPQPVKIGASTFWKHSDLQAFIANAPREPQSKAHSHV